MRIAILSPFYPYRGGIAQFSAMLYNALTEKGNTVKAFNFKKLYPDFLFPGKTQYVEKEDTAIVIESDRCLNSINIYSYAATLKHIKNFHPDILIISYWMSFFAPEYAYIAHAMKKRCKVIALVHNAIPHEPHLYDKPLASLFFKQCSGFAVMTQKVVDDICILYPKAQCMVSPHPLYNQFGKSIDALQAKKKLQIDLTKKTILFFGLIRDYKGLDILIESFGELDKSYQLLIAGEVYGNFSKYDELINKNSNKENIHKHIKYISDNEVSTYFSASDICVLPYKSATQSGITGISFHFETPMIATDVGGLAEIISHEKTGLICELPDAKYLAKSIKSYFEDYKQEDFVENIKKLKQELSWEVFADKILEFCKTF